MPRAGPSLRLVAFNQRGVAYANTAYCLGAPLSIVRPCMSFGLDGRTLSSGMKLWSESTPYGIPRACFVGICRFRVQLHVLQLTTDFSSALVERIILAQKYVPYQDEPAVPAVPCLLVTSLRVVSPLSSSPDVPVFSAASALCTGRSSLRLHFTLSLGRTCQLICPCNSASVGVAQILTSRVKI